ncbi:RNA binding (RRM/RBD/RNP motif) family protein [Forsythia ovata]|uniref:RNA binding (RRM/RBD/RNP motif) family protein n=1 Tax=Forsythia ovata TaxID=205694 RepID=A0ABD1RGH5_9LAMI
MDMAEKDETEGRCPACRTPYNKEKIVGMGANCERLVSEMSSEKKLKSQKGKSKTPEGRKQLSTVRVVQRNLVYVVGLPVNLADEDLLQHKEYFGQYGKVLKVSISRTAAGAIQQFANSTCSVYITYSKEEEAVRCIQAVHGFILEGRSLRACFGTTKYCHAWLRNVPCSNPDCLYLHEIGSQEDSFTKDEIISAYTRSRVQQITGATNSVQRHSGNVLPPPADDYCNSSYVSSGKPLSKTATHTNNSVNSIRVSPPNSSSGRSAALPAGASWYVNYRSVVFFYLHVTVSQHSIAFTRGTRASNNQPLSTSIPCSNGLHKEKPDACTGPVTFSTAVANPSHVSSLHSDTGKKLVHSEESNTSRDKRKLETVEQLKMDSSTDGRTILNSSSMSVLPVTSPINRQHGQPAPKEKDGDASMPPSTNDSVDQSLKSCGPDVDKDSIDATDGNIENICSEILSISIDRHQQLQNGYAEHIGESLPPRTSGKSASSIDEVYASNSQSEMNLERPTLVSQADLLEMDDNLSSFDKQRLKDPEFASNRSCIPDFSLSFHLSKHSNIHSPPHNNADGSVRDNLDRQIVYTKDNLIVSASSNPVMSNGHPKNELTSSSELVNDVEYSYMFPSSKDKSSLLGRFEGEVASHSRSAAVDMGESSIISNILSMDSYSWDESLTSPQNLTKLFGETDKKQGSFGVPSSRKIPNNNQSRFSFAREEEPMSRASDFGPTINYVEQALKERSFGHDFTNNNSFHLEKFGSHNRVSHFTGVESDNFASSSFISSNKLPVSRSQVSGPPGFSVPSRAPPPGFISHERTEQIFDLPSGNYMPDASSLPRNQYQAPPSGDSISNGEIEFMDPAILAVGKGMLPGSLNSSSLDTRLGYSPQFSTLEELRFQPLLQRSVPTHQNQRFADPTHQNQRYADLGDSFSPLADAYGVTSRVMELTLSNNLSPFSQFTLPQPRNAMTSNGQWDGWNPVQGENNLGMAEILRNERLGFTKFYGGYEDSKIRMPNSGNLYNGAYGI